MEEINDQNTQRLFESLPLDPMCHSVDSLRPSDAASTEDYFAVMRYLDSAPVILELATERVVAGRGTVRRFHSDGRFVWDDQEHTAAISGEAGFRRLLVRHALDHHGVCPALSEQDRHEARLAAIELLD